jgi:four helix bundle protein
MKTHKDLKVWNDAIAMVTEIYRLTKSFPESEKYELITQIQRSAVSIPSNIAEGAARTSDKEFAHFLSIALGSIAELETQVIIAMNLDYLSRAEFEKLKEVIIQIRRMTLGLRNKIMKPNTTNPNLITKHEG